MSRPWLDGVLVRGLRGRLLWSRYLQLEFVMRRGAMEAGMLGRLVCFVSLRRTGMRYPNGGGADGRQEGKVALS